VAGKNTKKKRKFFRSACNEEEGRGENYFGKKPGTNKSKIENGEIFAFALSVAFSTGKERIEIKKKKKHGGRKRSGQGENEIRGITLSSRRRNDP